uniref:SET domain-containing protein 4 n=1 Tax=Anser cygnoides TaxID=8845 RepID=A0A8B9DRJ2_ANSCY|nr:SET domain-containing protein 4 isoform X1 [Anser cygnoides]XP_047927370.1 SET domain-containing protein 4 isoform X1 [Anser cygnoides]XP_047927371.1 SET domain-containing protein 4 isoform X1 [Anser cygnoides]XP_047927372.1 SET domain-containing protein 4 isoform X1 [Anser cygnoides]XP_047927373.1 SET domain-containing protein 4 isoform X1 [Anser cygnoides]
MKRNRGRTGRKRRRKHLQGFMHGVNCSHKLEYIKLKKWLKERGFEDSYLRPAQFWDTGRGLMTTKALQAGELVISLPEKCLLTTDTVLSSCLGEYIIKWKPPVSPLIALCTFLVAEKHAGEKSLWKPYLDVLPKSYTCAVCLEQDVVSLLPEPLKNKAEEQRTMVHELHASSKAFFSSLQSLFAENTGTIFNYSALEWAWCTINTRTIYMKHSQRECFSLEPDVYALAPYLDLLNHSPNVQVKAAFNEQTRSYEIRTNSQCKKYEEVFICYGPHDNQRLLLEYGFVTTDNPHSTVYVSSDTLLKYFPPLDKQRDAKLSILKDHDFLQNLTFGWDGPSWRLLTALKLLSLGADEFTCWRRVLLGDVISARNEQQALNITAKICRFLAEETQRVLLQISQLKRDKENLKKHLSLVEALRLEDLKILQKSAEILCNLNVTTT